MARLPETPPIGDAKQKSVGSLLDEIGHTSRQRIVVKAGDRHTPLRRKPLKRDSSDAD